MSNFYQPLRQAHASTNFPDNGMKAYKYDCLKDGQIRLLKLHGVHAAEFEDAPLTGEIIVSTLLNDDEDSMGSGRSELSDNDAASKDEKKSSQTDEEEVDTPEYDALSYVWGGAEPRAKDGRVHRLLFIGKVPGQRSYLPISVNLEAALKSFRREVVPHGLEGVVPEGSRQSLYLWVDAVCINQASLAERSTQIRRMAAIYTEASLVRIWLGNKSEDAQVAFKFTERILSMEDFDRLISDTVTATEWRAFRGLLQMSWFKRRWIIQEIAFAKHASVYCGGLIMPWKKLAASISLFADARYELREMLRGAAEVTDNNPDYLGEVDAYSAKTLVECISSMFRRSGDESIMKNLLSLESLLTTLTPFDARDPHDSVYAIMHLSNDALPTSDGSLSNSEEIAETSSMDMAAIRRRSRSPEYTISGRERTLSPALINLAANHVPIIVPVLNLPPAQQEETRGRSLQTGNMAPGLEPPRSRSRGRSPSPGAARARAERGAESPAKGRIKKFKVDYSQSMFRLCLEVINWIVKQSGSIDIICKPWVPEISSALECEFYTVHPEDRITLPSWIQSLRKRTYGLDPLSDNKRYTRVAADPLIGTNSSGRKPYSACGDLPVPREYRPGKMIMPNERYLRTRGFVLDTVCSVGDKALNGAIPKQWLSMVGWENTDDDPPDAFWRTLVANRSSLHGPQQPPHHWPEACRWAFRRKTPLGDLNTEQLINNVYGVPSRRTLPFLERMRAVVWNRKLIKTFGFIDESTDHGPFWGPILGLAPEDVRPGDKIVILYGCSVPVVLRRNETKPKPPVRQSTQEKWKLSRRQRRPTNKTLSTVGDAVGSASSAVEPPVARPPLNVPPETYTLVGECYMHAFMDGEAFERNENPKRDEEFILGCVEKCNCQACSRS